MSFNGMRLNIPAVCISLRWNREILPKHKKYYYWNNTIENCTEFYWFIYCHFL